MGKTSAIRNFASMLLAVVLVCGTAHAGIRDNGVCPNDSWYRDRKGVERRANILYPNPTVFLRGDGTFSEDVSVGLGVPSVRGRAAEFWLPDSMETGWSARDKKLHFLACYSIVLTGEVATDRLESGVAWAAALSVAKELWDLWFKTPASQRGVSRGDLVADAVGLVAAVMLVEATDD